MLTPERDAQLLKHVRGHRIRAETDERTALHQLDDVRRADGVVHVRLRIVDDGGLGFREQIHFAPVDMNAVRGDGARAEDLKFLQPLDNAFAAVLQRPILIALRLGNVDVKAGVQFMAEGRGLFHRGVGNREGSVQAKERFHVRNHFAADSAG